MKYSFNQVKSLLDIVQPFLLRAGVSESACSMPTGDINLIKADKFLQAYDFLDEVLKSDEYENVMKIWKLLPPEVWRDYDLHEITGLKEQELLQESLVDLRNLWRFRQPRSFWGKHYAVDKNENQADS